MAHGIAGVIGCIDCTHVAINATSIDEGGLEEYISVNRKNYHSRNVQLVMMKLNYLYII